MTWPTDLTPERFPGTIRREMTVEATATEDRQLVFTAVLRDRWYDDAGNEEEIHGYEVRLATEPPDLTVVSVDVRPRFLPFPDCPAAALAARGLVGLRLTKGFRAGATAALGGVEGCTHLLTLVLAIWNHQVVTNYMVTRVDERTSHRVGAIDVDQIVDVCSGWREGGVAIDLVRGGKPLPRSVDRGD
jgi:hypothetical protein